MNNFLHNVVKSLAVALFVSSQAMAFYVNTSVIAAYTVGRVISQTVNEGGFTYHYDTRDNLVALSNAVLSVEYAHDSLNRLTHLVYRNASGATVASFGYTLDALGRATQARNNVGGTARVKNYAYDSLGRLAWTDDVASTTATPRPPAQPQTQSYDLAGNRLATGYGATAHTHNKITSANFTHNTAGEATQLSIPNPNNPLAPRNIPLSWNPLGQLEIMWSSPSTSNYYDILGRRVFSIPTTSATSSTHVWSGDQVVMDCVYNVTLAPEWSYSWGLGVDTLLACTLNPVAVPHVSNPPAPQVFYPIRDRLGSIMGLVDANGVMVARYDYDAWGNLATTWVANAHTYTLTHFRYRWQCREYVPLIHDLTLRIRV